MRKFEVRNMEDYTAIYLFGKLIFHRLGSYWELTLGGENVK